MLLQCSAVITRSIFYLILTKYTPNFARYGEIWGVICDLTLIYILLQWTQCCMNYCVILDRVITALDCIIPSPVIWSLQNYAHVTTAQLPCHVHNFVATAWIEFVWEQTEFSNKYYWWKKNGPQNPNLFTGPNLSRTGHGYRQTPHSPWRTTVKPLV